MRYVDENGDPIDPADLDEFEVADDVDDEDDIIAADEVGFDPDAEVPDDAPVRQSVPVQADNAVDFVDLVVDDAPPTPAPSIADATAFAAEPVEVGAVTQDALGAPTLNRRSKMLLAGGAVAAVAVIVGGIAFALNGVGSQHTVDDVKAAGQSKYARASSSVVAKSAEVRNEVTDTAIDTCSGGLAAAMVSGSRAPKLTLDVVSAAPLPSGFIAATAPNSDGQIGKVSMLQLTRTTWGVYVTTPLTRAEKKAEVERPGFWKADITVDDASIRVTGDRVWAGGDTGGAGSCEPGKPGVYAASGRVPADAMGLVDGQASVTAIQGVAGEPTKAVAVMGNSVVLVELVEAEPEGGEAASSSSAVPSK